MAEISFSMSPLSLSLLSSPTPTAPAPSDTDLLRSLLRLSREISTFDAPCCPLLRRIFTSLTRKSNILCNLFEDLLHEPTGNPTDLPRSASLCLREILVVLQRFKALLVDSSARSRMRILLQIDSICNDFHQLTLDLSTTLDILPLQNLRISDDVHDLIDLLRRQCRRSNPAVDPSDESLRYQVLSMIREIEQEVIPNLSRLKAIFDKLGLDGTRSCRNEIDCLEQEIGDRVSGKWTPAMISLVGVLRYAKCVLYGASTPTYSDSSAGKFSFTDSDPFVPPDFRCPVSLELMRDPVVVATGQTYDRDSITRWIAAGHATCPKSGQVLSHTNLVPNRALRNLISAWCREQNLIIDISNNGEPISAICANKAALEAAKMTATFLVKELSSSPSAEMANRVVHELRLLAKTGSENRAFVAEAGAIPLLLSFFSSDDSRLQLNAVTALLNLSILEANKKRIMCAEGGIEALIYVLASGATWCSKENAAATILSVSSIHVYRRRLGRNRRVVKELVGLSCKGRPASTKKDALAAILSLAGDRENIVHLVEGGVVETAFEAVDSMEVTEEAVAVLAALAKRGGAHAVMEAEASIAKLVGVMRRGSDWSKENAASALVLLCRRVGAAAVSELARMQGIEWVIWELTGSGTVRGRRKAAALGRIYRRWLVAVEEADLVVRFSPANFSTNTTTAQS